MVKVSIGILGLQKWFNDDLKSVLDLVRIADVKGVDQLSVTEHVVMGEATDKYPYGKFPLPLDYPWYEPVALLGALAAVTERIRLSTGILISPLRSAVLLAKQLATLDVLSRGRITIGLGVGWQREEYDASGIPWDSRFELQDEQLRACKELWTLAPATFHGKHTNFERAYSRPFPVQPGGVPFWFGVAPTERNFRRIAEFGSGWIPMERDPEKLSEAIGRLRAAFSAAGRDPAVLNVRAVPRPVLDKGGTADLEASISQVSELMRAGVTMVEFPPTQYCRGPETFEKFIDRIVRLKDY